jgi:hypothetical protein
MATHATCNLVSCEKLKKRLSVNLVDALTNTSFINYYKEHGYCNTGIYMHNMFRKHMHII